MSLVLNSQAQLYIGLQHHLLGFIVTNGRVTLELFTSPGINRPLKWIIFNELFFFFSFPDTLGKVSKSDKEFV